MKNKRLSWLDSLRGFGIILITLGHLGCFELLERYIYSFHVPLFFFISGYLYRRGTQPLSTYIKKKTLTILVPFLTWTFLSTMVNVVLGYDIIPLIKRALTINGQLTWNSPLWFLLVLYFVEVLFTLLDRANERTHFKMIIFAVSLIIFVLIGDIRLTLKLNLVPFAMVFYCMGNIMRRSIENRGLFLKRWQKYPLALLLLLTGFVFGGVLNTRIKYTHAIWGNYLYLFIAAFCSILFYYILFRNVDKIGYSKLLTYLGKNSMIIMCAQYWVFRFFDIITKRVWDRVLWHKRDSLKAVLFTFFTIVVICLMTEGYKKLSKNNKALTKFGNLLGIR